MTSSNCCLIWPTIPDPEVCNSWGYKAEKKQQILKFEKLEPKMSHIFCLINNWLIIIKQLAISFLPVDCHREGVSSIMLEHLLSTSTPSHCVSTPRSACTLPPNREEPRSSCPSSERWKAAMSAEDRPVKRRPLTGRKEAATSANRGFLSCRGDLELDWALSLYAALFYCMDGLAFKYHSSQHWGDQQLWWTYSKCGPVQCRKRWHLWTISSLI